MCKVQRVESRKLRRKGDPCCSLEAPYSVSYQPPRSAVPVPAILCLNNTRCLIERRHHGSSKGRLGCTGNQVYRHGSRAAEMAGHLRDRSVLCAPRVGSLCLRLEASHACSPDNVPVEQCSTMQLHDTITAMSCFHSRAVLPCQVLARTFIPEATAHSILTAGSPTDLSGCSACPGTRRWPRPISRDWKMGQSAGKSEGLTAIAQSSFEASGR